MGRIMSEPKVYKKRPHRKVKSGCSTCKRRKIKVSLRLRRLFQPSIFVLTRPKCDEDKPQCSNCARYSADCVYPSPSSSSDTSRDHASTSAPTTPSLVHTPESIVEEPPVPQCPPGTNDLPIRDLVLMHQWSVSTCFGFGDEFPGEADPWRVDVPVLGQQNHFLMRGILAVTSLHLSRLTMDPAVRVKYIQLAAYHQDLALPDYRRTILNVTEHNVAAILAFSALTTVYSFAAPKDPGSFFSGGAPEWIFLHRGVGTIPPEWQDWVDRSPLSHQMHRRRIGPIDATINPEDFRLIGLYGILSSLPLEEHGEGEHYEDALHWLRQAFAHTFNPESRMGPKYAVLFFIERVSQGFLELLNLQKPRALILLAHLCILLHRASKFWYLDGFAPHVLSEMQPGLSHEFLPWIEWPLEVCGIV
ncbi:hypothetical protein EJ04DRAFT_271353 [Polyplosphaeria fusca]|uniref:Zn(2)-C6 fungal-type domain-containing protein n=1 Tax=Polyplosphaeria fusca TaxID=682080 RepID=A0A9P4V2P9_9PLEO|nr:hypothetical protein EJ04DRAFT_271353 [Polyplosphaeria fusca]